MEEHRPWGPPWRQDRRTGRYHAPDPGAFRRRRSTGAGAAVVAGFLQVVGANNATGDGLVTRPVTAAVVALLLVGPFALLWRKKFPVAVFVIAAAASLLFATIAVPRWTWAVAPAIALFNLAKLGRPRAAVAGAALTYAAYFATCWAFADRLHVPAVVRPEVRDLVLLAVGLVVLIFLGGAAKVRGEHMVEMMKVRAEQARAAEEQERRQTSEERLRMARELHDVLGHHLSLINVQAGVGLHLMDNNPEQAREALTAIKSASAEALREVRAVLTALRADDETAPRQPAVSLSRLADLTADAALPVTTRVTGRERRLPPEVDRAAYRIVQEALTNALKHAGPHTRVHLALRIEGSRLRITVRDTGPPAGDRPLTATGEGHGVVGMRERAALYAGTVTAGPAPGGGWAVAADLELGSEPS